MKDKQKKRHRVHHRKLQSKDGFPPLPPADQIPIIINSPPVNIPKPESPYESAGRLIFVPTIIYPKHKKRVIVHHGYSMADYYRKMFFTPSIPYMKMASVNPHYEGIVKNSDFFTKLKKNKEFSKGMDLVDIPSGGKAQAPKMPMRRRLI